MRLAGHWAFWAALVIGLYAAPAWPQTREEQWSRCRHAAPDIDACTALIQSNRETGSDLIIAHYLRGFAYEGKAEHARAIQDFDRVLSLDPSHSRAYWARGVSYGHLKQYARAIQDFDELIRLEPSLGAAYSNRGFAYASLGQHERAIADYNEAIRLKTDDYALANRCYSRAVLGQLDAALKDCNEAAYLKPPSIALEGRAIVHLKAGRFDAAIADFDAATRLHPERRAVHLYGRGLARKGRGDIVGGAADIAAALTLYPAIAEDMAKLGVR